GAPGRVGQPQGGHPARGADLDDVAGRERLREEPHQPSGVGLEHPPPVQPVGLGRVVLLGRREQVVDDLLRRRFHHTSASSRTDGVDPSTAAAASASPNTGANFIRFSPHTASTAPLRANVIPSPVSGAWVQYKVSTTSGTTVNRSRAKRSTAARDALVASSGPTAHATAAASTVPPTDHRPGPLRCW